MIQLKPKKSMKSSRIPAAAILVLMIVVGVLILSAFTQPTTAALHAQVTSTPAAEDDSVIGSTNGIVVMGFLIVFIVSLPLIFRRKKK